MTGLRDMKHHGLPRESVADKAVRMLAYAAIGFMCIWFLATGAFALWGVDTEIKASIISVN